MNIALNLSGSSLTGDLPTALALGIMDFEFMGGSMGVVVGEKVAVLFGFHGIVREAHRFAFSNPAQPCFESPESL